MTCTCGDKLDVLVHADNPDEMQDQLDAEQGLMGWSDGLCPACIDAACADRAACENPARYNYFDS